MTTRDRMSSSYFLKRCCLISRNLLTFCKQHAIYLYYCIYRRARSMQGCFIGVHTQNQSWSYEKICLTDRLTSELWYVSWSYEHIVYISSSASPACRSTRHLCETRTPAIISPITFHHLAFFSSNNFARILTVLSTAIVKSPMNWSQGQHSSLIIFLHSFPNLAGVSLGHVGTIRHVRTLL